MTEIEQLRKELNELRERLAQVEARTVPLMTFGQPPQITPKYEVRVSCGDASREQAINQGRAIQRGMQAELGRRSRNT